MPRPKPKSTINDLLIFFLIGYIFCQHAFHYTMHPAAQIMFAIVFFILSVFKLRYDKRHGKTIAPAYTIMGISWLQRYFFL